jgi:hypothetical protein
MPLSFFPRTYSITPPPLTPLSFTTAPLLLAASSLHKLPFL